MWFFYKNDDTSVHVKEETIALFIKSLRFKELKLT